MEGCEEEWTKDSNLSSPAEVSTAISTQGVAGKAAATTASVPKRQHQEKEERQLEKPRQKTRPTTKTTAETNTEISKKAKTKQKKTMC